LAASPCMQARTAPILACSAHSPPRTARPRTTAGAAWTVRASAWGRSPWASQCTCACTRRTPSATRAPPAARTPRWSWRDPLAAWLRPRPLHATGTARTPCASRRTAPGAGCCTPGVLAGPRAGEGGSRPHASSVAAGLQRRESALCADHRGQGSGDAPGSWSVAMSKGWPFADAITHHDSPGACGRPSCISAAVCMYIRLLCCPLFAVTKPALICDVLLIASWRAQDKQRGAARRRVRGAGRVRAIPRARVRGGGGGGPRAGRGRRCHRFYGRFRGRRGDQPRVCGHGGCAGARDGCAPPLPPPPHAGCMRFFYAYRACVTGDIVLASWVHGAHCGLVLTELRMHLQVPKSVS